MLTRYVAMEEVVITGNRLPIVPSGVRGVGRRRGRRAGIDRGGGWGCGCGCGWIQQAVKEV